MSKQLEENILQGNVQREGSMVDNVSFVRRIFMTSVDI